jgi:signal transduction histidine kinase
VSENAAALPLPAHLAWSTAEREALLEAARLSSLGELVRGFAHEINNPLFGMLGLAELLLDEIEPGTKPYERLVLLHRSGLEIKSITQRLMAYARAEAEPDQVVSLREVAAETVELVRCTSAGGSADVRERYCDEPLEVFGSRARLAQVLLGLLVTFQKPNPDGGVVTVQLDRDGDWALADVTGPPGEARDMGFGLAAAHEVARMHGGDLVSLPTVGGGTSFVLRLPLRGVAR